jgi:hypothetical protein
MMSIVGLAIVGTAVLRCAIAAAMAPEHPRAARSASGGAGLPSVGLVLSHASGIVVRQHTAYVKANEGTAVMIGRPPAIRVAADAGRLLR